MTATTIWSEALVARARRHFADHLAGRRAAVTEDLPPAAEAFAAWALSRALGRTVLWVGDSPHALEEMERNLRTLAPLEAGPIVFPAWEALPVGAEAPPDPRLVGARLAALLAMRAAEHSGVVATCVQALMERTLPPAAAEERTVRLPVGAEFPPLRLAEHLQAGGYQFRTEVQCPGEAALRGGILDVWPISSGAPIRLDFLGDAIESARLFDPVTQRSGERMEEVVIPPAGEGITAEAGGPPATLADHLSGELAVLWSDWNRIEQHGRVYEETIAEMRAERATLPLAAALQAVRGRGPSPELFLGTGPADASPMEGLDFSALRGVASQGRAGLHPDLLEAQRQRLIEELRRRAEEGVAAWVCFETEGARTRFLENYGAAVGFAQTAAFGPLSGGFVSVACGLAVASETDFYGAKRYRRRVGRARMLGVEEAVGARVSDWSEIEPGDLVVHAEHGIGRYLGLREIRVQDRPQEGLAIEYAEGARLYVPVAQAHLLTRYVGVGKRHPPLHRLGGTRWRKEKEAAARAVEDMAAQLLETQAARSALEGFACPPDTPWQHEMEAAFPYEETPDQAEAIAAVKADMEAARPMDRLLCGDAGYGKTEVAVRAAFKMVMAGRQVAVLTPTTVLAQQHAATFRERMAAFPVRIEMLSRFCSPVEAARIREGLEQGVVDVVIGTHALLRPDIRFCNLGLVIIDEEQRFGVRHKERLKEVRRLVDVLTLTATPIPRTLYMSLTGARDLSTIQTPPQERRGVETIVAWAEDEAIRRAILRELNRGGQVYFIYNRIRTMERMQARLARLVPEARIVMAHGQMPAQALSAVVRAFAEGAYDVLLCTTIVESGVDIPNANTILIDRADRFGLAELYQLRGRVGRSRHKAYAYMLLPAHAEVDAVARRRIQAVRQYSGAGAGFRLAMRDLEIRGAGNLLGPQQSGHIAAIGFGLYCQLLKRSIALARGESPPPVVDVELALDFLDLSPDAGADGAFLPSGYIEDERVRVGLYRRFAEAGRREELAEVEAELRERFGALPPPARRLLKLAALRIAAAEKGLQAVQVRDGRVTFRREGRPFPGAGGRGLRLTAANPDERLDELLEWVGRLG